MMTGHLVSSGKPFLSADFNIWNEHKHFIRSHQVPDTVRLPTVVWYREEDHTKQFSYNATTVIPYYKIFVKHNTPKISEQKFLSSK